MTLNEFNDLDLDFINIKEDKKNSHQNNFYKDVNDDVFFNTDFASASCLNQNEPFLISMDLDGTLLSDDKSISDNVIKTIEFYNHIPNANLMIATAKSYNNTKMYADFFKIKNYSAFNGAINVIDDKIVFKSLYTYERFLFDKQWLENVLNNHFLNLKKDVVGYYCFYGLEEEYYVLFNKFSKDLKNDEKSNILELKDINENFFLNNEIYAVSTFIGSKNDISEFDYQRYEIYKNEICLKNNLSKDKDENTNKDASLFPLLISTKRMNLDEFEYAYFVLYTYSNKLNTIKQTQDHYKVKDEKVMFIGDDQNDRIALQYYKNSLIMHDSNQSLDDLNKPCVPSVDYALNKAKLKPIIYNDHNKITYLIDGLVFNYQGSLKNDPSLLNQVKNVILTNKKKMWNEGYETDKNFLNLDLFYQLEPNLVSDDVLIDINGLNEKAKNLNYGLKNNLNEFIVHRVYFLKDSEGHYLEALGFLFSYKYNLILYLPTGHNVLKADISYFCYRDLEGSLHYQFYSFYDLMDDNSLLNKVSFFDFYFLGCVFDENIIEDKINDDNTPILLKQKLALIKKSHLSFQKVNGLIKFIDGNMNINHQPVFNANSKPQIYLTNLNLNLLRIKDLINRFKNNKNVDIYLNSQYETTKIKKPFEFKK